MRKTKNGFVQKSLCLLLVLQVAISGNLPALAIEPPPFPFPSTQDAAVTQPSPGTPAPQSPQGIPVPPNIQNTLDQLERCVSLPTCSVEAGAAGLPFRLAAQNPCDPSQEQLDELREYMRLAARQASRAGTEARVIATYVYMGALFFAYIAGDALGNFVRKTMEWDFQRIASEAGFIGYIGTISLIVAGMAGAVIRLSRHAHAEGLHYPLNQGILDAGHNPDRIRELLASPRFRSRRNWVRNFGRNLQRRLAIGLRQSPQVSTATQTPPANSSPQSAAPQNANPANASAAPSAAETPTQTRTPPAAATVEAHPPTRVRVVLNGNDEPCVPQSDINTAADEAYEELLQAEAAQAAAGARARNQRVGTPLQLPSTAAPAAEIRPVRRRVIRDGNPPAQAAFQNAIDGSMILHNTPALPAGVGAAAGSSAAESGAAGVLVTP